MFLVLSLVLLIKENYKKMELSLSHTLHLFNIFCEYDGKDNCAQVLEEEISKMFGTKSLNDEHDCNVVSMNSLNTHDANDDCTSYDEISLMSMSTFVECMFA